MSSNSEMPVYKIQNAPIFSGYSRIYWKAVKSIIIDAKQYGYLVEVGYNIKLCYYILKESTKLASKKRGAST
jgi:hypothetical protein